MSLPTEADFAIIKIGDGATPTEAFAIACGIQDVSINQAVGTQDRFSRDCAKPGEIPNRKVKATGKHAHIAPWLEYGTAAHKITAKGKGMFFGGLFVKGVQHPGSRPKPFMRPALDGRAQDAVSAAARYMKQRLATKHGLDTSGIEVDDE